jgi:fructose-1-phosphate kinase PfkB-like protein
MVSLGEQGALLIHNGNTIIATPPSIKALSTIGAGDSSIAGFLCATYQNLSATERIATAVSFGSAACMTEGTHPPRAEDVKALLSTIQVEKL